MTIRAAMYTWYTLAALALVLIIANIGVAARNANCWQSVPTYPGTTGIAYETVNVCK